MACFKKPILKVFLILIHCYLWALDYFLLEMVLVFLGPQKKPLLHEICY